MVWRLSVTAGLITPLRATVPQINFIFTFLTFNTLTFFGFSTIFSVHDKYIINNEIRYNDITLVQ